MTNVSQDSSKSDRVA